MKRWTYFFESGNQTCVYVILQRKDTVTKHNQEREHKKHIRIHIVEMLENLLRNKREKKMLWQLKKRLQKQIDVSLSNAEKKILVGDKAIYPCYFCVNKAEEEVLSRYFEKEEIGTITEEVRRIFCMENSLAYLQMLPSEKNVIIVAAPIHLWGCDLYDQLLAWEPYVAELIVLAEDNFQKEEIEDELDNLWEETGFAGICYVLSDYMENISQVKNDGRNQEMSACILYDMRGLTGGQIHKLKPNILIDEAEGKDRRDIRSLRESAIAYKSLGNYLDTCF